MVGGRRSPQASPCPIQHIDTLDDGASVLLWYLECVKNESKSRLPSHSSCCTLLSEHDNLLDLLKNAHSTRDYFALDSSELIHRQRFSWSSQFEDARRVLNQILETEVIQQVVVGEDSRRIWTPEDENDPDSDIIDHIRDLCIPHIQESPPLPLIILHNLGSFQESPLLQKRLDNIFSPGQDT
ncbi:hypothetical protein Moror_13735, partial [Moniliophthora roreri MCA 2997]